MDLRRRYRIFERTYFWPDYSESNLTFCEDKDSECAQCENHGCPDHYSWQHLKPVTAVVTSMALVANAVAAVRTILLVIIFQLQHTVIGSRRGYAIRAALDLRGC